LYQTQLISNDFLKPVETHSTIFAIIALVVPHKAKAFESVLSTGDTTIVLFSFTTLTKEVNSKFKTPRGPFTSIVHAARFASTLSPKTIGNLPILDIKNTY